MFYTAKQWARKLFKSLIQPGHYDHVMAAQGT
jgi:hypothetical protein